jgi:hypothetical protein
MRKTALSELGRSVSDALLKAHMASLAMFFEQNKGLPGFR